VAFTHARTRVNVITSAFSGGVNYESDVKEVSKLSVTGQDLDTVKGTALTVVSQELFRHALQADLIFRRELERAVAKAANSVFLPLLTGGASIASSGATAIAVRQDLRTLAQNVTSGSDAKLFFIMDQQIFDALTYLSTTTGAAAFPEVGASRQLGNVPIIVCDEATAGEIILVDASQVAAASEDFRIDVSRHASVQLDSVPDSPPTASTFYVSLWQQNLVGLLVERSIAAKVLRTTAVAKITNVAYSGSSPA
jgi:HK97 family phage major capsid protein